MPPGDHRATIDSARNTLGLEAYRQFVDSHEPLLDSLRRQLGDDPDEAAVHRAVVKYAREIGALAQCLGYDHFVRGTQQMVMATHTIARNKGFMGGAPDLAFFEPRYFWRNNSLHLYHGLFIELKRNASCRPSKHQVEYIQWLRERGYQAVCIGGFDNIVRRLREYVKLPRTRDEAFEDAARDDEIEAAAHGLDDLSSASLAEFAHGGSVFH